MYEKLVLSLTKMEKLDKLVDEWHLSDTNKSLQEYLNLKDGEFLAFLHGRIEILK